MEENAAWKWPPPLRTKGGSVQLSRVWLFATPWTAASQTSLSITKTGSLHKLMSIESVMPSNISSSVSFSSCLQSFPTSGSFTRSQLFAWGGQSTKSQGWSPLEWTGWISLQFKGLSSLLQHYSSKASILWHSAFFAVQISHPYMTTGKNIALTRQTFVGK